MKILLVEDNKEVRDSISEFLMELGHTIHKSSNGKDALRILKSETVHLVLSDIRMPFMDGHALLKKIKESKQFEEIEVVLFTGHGDIKDAIEAIREGAYDYLLKPVNVKELDVIINRISEYLTLKRKTQQLTEKFEQEVNAATKDVKAELLAVRKAFAREVGTSEIGIFSPSLRKVFEAARKLHHSPEVSVLIEGETGTGKELLARFIHFGDGEVITPFVGLNCAAISTNLFESELFGYEAGAFTGGHPKGQKGKLEFAQNGSLFLDEITEMPVEHQAKLLRVIQEREYYKVGGLQKLTTDARFICTTNQSVKQLVEKGSFRQDLFFRLNIGHIRIPPLRERKEEILPLAKMFLNQLGQQRKSSFETISSAAEKLLKNYSWPGNVRELKNTIERSILYWDEPEIRPEHLEFLFQSQSDIKREKSELKINNILLPDQGLDINALNLEIVKKALEKNNGNKTNTARYLGISLRVLHTYLKHIKGH
jgi:DNA-binding NtrC family response regulator